VDGPLNDAPAIKVNEPRRRVSAAWGLLFGYAGVFLSVARNILLVPVYLRFVPLAQYGAWLATGATLIQLLVSDFGVAGVLTQRSSALHGAGESKALGELMGSGLVAGLILTAASLAVGVGVVAAIPMLPGLGDQETSDLIRCLYLAVLAAALGILGAIAQGLIRSLQLSVAAGTITLAAEVLNILVSVLLLFQGAGLYSLVWGMLARSAFLAIGSALCLGWNLRGKVALSAHRTQVSLLFADGGVSLITALSMKSLTQANTLFVGLILGPTSAAAYGLTVRAYETLAVFLGQMNAALAPAMAHLWGSGNTSRFRAVLANIASGSALAAALGVVAVVCVNESFVRLWLHRPVFAGQMSSILMATAIWVSQIGYVAYDALYSLGRFRYIATTFLIAEALQIVLLVSFLHFGLWMVPLASVLTAFVWGGAFWLRVTRELDVSRADRTATLTDLLTIALCALAVGTSFLALYSPSESWDGLITRAAASAFAMLVAALAVSTRLRAMITVELRMTLRSFMARHGV
jgi:O-antigen/teichoic acid export membrane protein